MKTAPTTLACVFSRGRRALLSAFVVALPLAATLAAGNAHAQNFPDRPIRLIVTHAAGGALDVSARQLAERLGPKLGQQVIVENRVGAAGMVATSFVAKAPADGYTLAFVSASFTILPVIYPNMNFQMSDLTGVANVVQAPFVLSVAPNAPFKSFSDFVTQAKAQPNKFAWGSGGNGSFGHLLGAWFSAEADARITHVPYKGEAPAITALLSNDVTIVPINITSAIPLIKAGKLKALAVSGSKRSPLLPDVPTIAEQSVQVAVAPWFAMIAPAGVPKPILARLNQAVNEVLQDRDLRDRFLNAGFEIGGGPESTLNAMIEREGKQWARIVKDRGVTFD